MTGLSEMDSETAVLLTEREIRMLALCAAACGHLGGVNLQLEPGEVEQAEYLATTFGFINRELGEQAHDVLCALSKRLIRIPGDSEALRALEEGYGGE